MLNLRMVTAANTVEGDQLTLSLILSSHLQSNSICYALSTTRAIRLFSVGEIVVTIFLSADHDHLLLFASVLRGYS